MNEELTRITDLLEECVSLVRPDCWAFAMDFLGDPEASIVEAYVTSLEAEVKRLRDADRTIKEELS